MFDDPERYWERWRDSVTPVKTWHEKGRRDKEIKHSVMPLQRPRDDLAARGLEVKLVFPDESFRRLIGELQIQLNGHTAPDGTILVVDSAIEDDEQHGLVFNHVPAIEGTRGSEQALLLVSRHGFCWRLAGPGLLHSRRRDRDGIGRTHLNERLWTSLELLAVVDDVVALELLAELGVVAHAEIVIRARGVTTSFQVGQAFLISFELLLIVGAFCFLSFSHHVLGVWTPRQIDKAMLE